MIETRSAFSSTIHHAYVVHIEEVSYFSHVRRGFSPVVCRQLSHPPLANCYLAVFSFSVVGRWSDSFFDIVDGFLASGRVCHLLLDGQLVNELVRCFVGVLRPPFLSLCVPGCYPIHDNLVKMWCKSFLHASATPHSWC